MKAVKRMRYSPTEQKLLNHFVRIGARYSTHDLVQVLYRGKVPYHGNVVVASAMRSLIVKVRRNREEFKIVGSQASGPVVRQFWMERR